MKKFNLSSAYIQAIDNCYKKIGEIEEQVNNDSEIK